MARKCLLSVQSLEPRALPDGGPPTPVGISLNAFGTLLIKGDDHRDWATVTVDGDQIHALHQHRVPGPVPGTPDMYETFQDKSFPLTQVKRITFLGGDNGDSFTNDTTIPCLAAGGAGDDILVGGTGPDTLSGGDGNDLIEGRRGNDVLRGGPGSDVYRFVTSLTPVGADSIVEAANADFDRLDFSAFGPVTIDLSSTAPQTVRPVSLSLTLSDGRGIEAVDGSGGSDNIRGNSRPNELNGNGGPDTLNGASGNDSLYGGPGNDVLTPMDGNNTVTDGGGDDLVDFRYNAAAVSYTTGGGNDTVIGTGYADHLTGSAGNDSLDGGRGNDTLDGGAGNDTLLGGYGNNTLHDGLGNDRIDFHDNAVAVNFTSGGGDDMILGTKFGDRLRGSAGNDTLHGGAGSDSLYGLAGTDELFGEAGNDWLEAGSAAEPVDGGSGTDYNAHRWAVGGTTASDVRQAGLGSCVFLSTLSGAADRGMDLASRITYVGNFHYRVRLFNLATGAADDQDVVFNGLMHYDAAGKRIDPYSADPGEFWTILFQRAYVQMSDNSDLDFTDPDDAMYAVTGRSVDGRYLWLGDPAEYRSALQAGQVVIAYWADNTDQVYDAHAYTVMSVYQSNGLWRIKLRNPWGEDVKPSDIANGTKVPTGSNSDGIIDITWSRFTGHNDFDGMSIS
jgi:Ca2+-binding RTX toxin-like protein